MMKKVLSTLAIAAFMGAAHAATLTIGGQVNPGIKFRDGNYNEDGSINYYLDGSDTKVFLNYKDAARDIEGTIVGDFNGKDGDGNKGVFEVNQAWLKFNVYKQGPITVFMKLGKQPTVIDDYDISITEVYGPTTANYNYNANVTNPKVTLGANKVVGATIGVTLQGITAQMTLSSDNTFAADSYARVAEFALLAPTKYVDLVGAVQFTSGVPGYDKDDQYLAYGYADIKAITPVDVKLQAAYGKTKNVDKSGIWNFAAKLTSKKAFKLISKPAIPYFAVQYMSQDDNATYWTVGDIINNPKYYDYRLGDNNEDTYNYYENYTDSALILKAGMKVKFSPALEHDGYVKYFSVSAKNGGRKIAWEVGGDFTLKFAKTVEVK